MSDTVQVKISYHEHPYANDKIKDAGLLKILNDNKPSWFPKSVAIEIQGIPSEVANSFRRAAINETKANCMLGSSDPLILSVSSNDKMFLPAVFIQNIANLPCIAPVGTKAVLKLENKTNEIIPVKASHVVISSKITWTTMPNATIGLLYPRSSLEGEFTVVEKHGVWSPSYLGSHTCKVHYQTTEPIADHKTRATTRFNYSKWKIQVFPFADSSPKNFMKKVTRSMMERIVILRDQIKNATDSTKNDYMICKQLEDHMEITFEKEYITLINAVARLANDSDSSIKFITSGPAMGPAIMKGMIRVSSIDWKNLLANACNEYLDIVKKVNVAL